MEALQKGDYESARSELLACREKLSHLNVGILSLIIATLAFGVALFEQLRNIVFSGDVYADRINYLIIFIELLAFTLPFIILLLLSFKIRNNYKTLLALTIYIKVFYEFKPSSKENKFYLEIIRSDTVETEFKSKNFLDKIIDWLNKNLINKEFIVLATFSSMLLGIFFLIFGYNLFQNDLTIFRWFLFIAIIITSPTVICQFIIFKNTSMQNIEKRYKKIYAEKIIDKAINAGLIEYESRKDYLFSIIQDIDE